MRVSCSVGSEEFVSVMPILCVKCGGSLVLLGMENMFLCSSL